MTARTFTEWALALHDYDTYIQQRCSDDVTLSSLFATSIPLPTETPKKAEKRPKTIREKLDEEGR